MILKFKHTTLIWYLDPDCLIPRAILFLYVYYIVFILLFKLAHISQLHREVDTTPVDLLKLCSEEFCDPLRVFLNHVKRSCYAPLKTLFIRIFSVQDVKRYHSLKSPVASSFINIQKSFFKGIHRSIKFFRFVKCFKIWDYFALEMRTQRFNVLIE